jgi:hypothetical protein
MSDMVTIPRKEYAELLVENAQLRKILQAIYDTTTDVRIKSTLASWLSEQRYV